MTAVELAKVTLRRGGRKILSDVDARVGEGEFIGVFGPNGAGKTTLLLALLGLIPPVAGEIRIFGEVPRRGTPLAGYLPQNRGALADLRLRVWDVVASAFKGRSWGLPILGAEGRREVASALDIVGATTLAKRPMDQLSGGELQRVLLAKALLGKPRLLLLDEPLMSLDPRYQQAMVELVRRVQEEIGMTVLFTAHELNPLLGAMDRVLYLGGGCAALGTVDEVVRGDVLSRLYGAPIEVIRVKDRIVVLTPRGPADAEAHRHDA